ncbi:carbamoyl-phosphate synthase large subunit [Lactobacillus delbrueckii]|uniref:carbamoyl-phosphate synthase large subunit n=1 Tax=Lactobacillus delbrueckii TaxID=1584 RepID=UPI0021A4141C|nr:carbamoyl-phosphate synthase large subunit [Lactobacillus delbrueckii]MCT3510180.1 carbamoyl-phosphate synthase large subunit [Lactobacillus delbrueckii subsp. bulgaricus]MCT3512191.1 carbamoyl-phosphate synthase large subunit [Lactobacillus delbrueckii subsp. bulgaricus]
MPKRDDIKKVLVIGSGPIIIGQAAEFDYAGTQACRALREEGIEVVLINSNPATIMTDGDMADHVYIEPLTVPVVKQLIEKEKPDALLPTMGGQNALNIAMALADEGFLEKHHVKTIGTDTDTIKMAEDRLEFKNLMERIGEPVAKSVVVNYVEDAIAFAKEIGYPVVVRPAYTLGGTGGGIAHNEQELHEICSNGLRLSRVTECLIEQSIAGWKEVEYEVMRDGAGNCITVCNMENMDPVGVHTGDSIVVAPSQTLSDKDYQMLRSSALNIITALNIKGGCNVQFALNPDSFEYCVIEVNPRVSRSSALASKATGYPIAKLATKIALGYNLDEIVNAVTGKTYASYEPTLDYIVCKIPKWPFDKFYDASRKLGTQMKATGEVMAICNNFEGAFMKALRSLEQDSYYLYNEEIAQLSADDLCKDLRKIDDKRAFRIAEALRKGVSIREIHAITKIDVWFIDKIKHLVEIEDRLKNEELTPDLLKLAKHCEFPDRVIASLTGKTAEEALKAANELGYPVLVRPSYVLGGAGMEIALNDGDLKRFIDHITSQFNIEDHPILIDKYLAGKECEVDAICDDEGILIPGIMEHVERAGVHSGDSISIYPPQKISQEMKERIVEYSKRLAKALKVKGLMNIQFIVYENKVYVIEVNPRSSRTIPYISKVTGIPLVDVATNVIIGKSIKEQGYDYGLAPEKKTVAVKMPVFSFEKITGAEIALGPEMKSTGEVLGISEDVEEAMYKAFMGTGLDLPKHKKVICTVKDSAKEEFLPIAKEYHDFGYDLYATQGTYDFLQSHGIPARLVNRINDKENTIFDLILTETVDLVIDIPTRNNNLKDGFLIRRFAVEAGVPIYTSLDTARALIHALEAKHDNKISLVDITKL